MPLSDHIRNERGAVQKRWHSVRADCASGSIPAKPRQWRHGRGIPEAFAHGKTGSMRLPFAEAGGDLAFVMKRLAVVVVAIVSGNVACQESAPSLQLHVDGAADPSTVRVEYMLAGPFGGYRSQLRGSANLAIPMVVEGQSARSFRAIVFCPGYHTVHVEIPDVEAQTESRVALDALPVRRLVGTVEFVGGAKPRSFVLDIDVMVPSSHGFFGFVDGAVTTFDVSQAVVNAEGDFSVVVADLAEDSGLQSSGEPSVFRFHARDAATGNFVFDLMPGEIALGDLPQALVISASPVQDVRPKTEALDP